MDRRWGIISGGWRAEVVFVDYDEACTRSSGGVEEGEKTAVVHARTKQNKKKKESPRVG